MASVPRGKVAAKAEAEDEEVDAQTAALLQRMQALSAAK